MIISDLHIHSKYSRATSGQLSIDSLEKWARIKGINLLGTGDFTHPGWFGEIKEKLVPAEPGLFKLKEEIEKRCDQNVPVLCREMYVLYWFLKLAIYTKKIKKPERIIILFLCLILKTLKSLISS